MAEKDVTCRIIKILNWWRYMNIRIVSCIFGTIKVHGKNTLRNILLFFRTLKVYKYFRRISVYIFISCVCLYTFYSNGIVLILESKFHVIEENILPSFCLAQQVVLKVTEMWTTWQGLPTPICHYETIKTWLCFLCWYCSLYLCQ
jgi:hypothetical protein